MRFKKSTFGGPAPPKIDSGYGPGVMQVFSFLTSLAAIANPK